MPSRSPDRRRFLMSMWSAPLPRRMRYGASLHVSYGAKRSRSCALQSTAAPLPNRSLVGLEQRQHLIRVLGGVGDAGPVLPHLAVRTDPHGRANDADGL